LGAHVGVVTRENWDQEIMNEALPIVVDLWAPWCGPCRALAPILEEQAVAYHGKVKVVKVNVDEQGEIAQAFEVQSIPMLAILYQGSLVGKVVGFGGREQLIELFKEVATVPEKVAQAPKEEPPAGG